MKINKLSLRFTLLSFILLLPIGCRQQAAKVQNIEQTAEPLIKAAPIIESKEIAPKQIQQVANLLPRISFEKKVCDLGEVGQDTKNTCEFKFTNTGQDLLKIGNIKRTCGCTVFELEKKEYAPGETGIVKVSYIAGSSTAHMEKSIDVPTNDKDNSNVKLKIKANVVQMVEATPSKLQLSLRQENAGISEITLKSRDNKPFSIKGFQSTNRNSIAAGFDPNAIASEFVLHPKTDFEKLKTTPKGFVEVQLTHPQCRSVRIPYELLLDFKAIPEMVILANVKPQEVVTREITIASNYGEDFEIESTESKNGMVKVLGQDKTENSYKLKVHIIPPMTTANNVFSDTLYVNIKGKDRLAVDCRGFYSKPAVATANTQQVEKNILRFKTDPPVVKVRDANPGQAVTAEVLVAATDGKDFQVESASSQKGIVELIGKEKVGDRYKLKLKITPPPSEHRLEVFSDVLYVTIKSSGNDSDVMKLPIPCRGTYARNLARYR